MRAAADCREANRGDVGEDFVVGIACGESQAAMEARSHVGCGAITIGFLSHRPA